MTMAYCKSMCISFHEIQFVKMIWGLSITLQITKKKKKNWIKCILWQGSLIHITDLILEFAYLQVPHIFGIVILVIGVPVIRYKLHASSSSLSSCIVMNREEFCGNLNFVIDESVDSFNCYSMICWLTTKY